MARDMEIPCLLCTRHFMPGLLSLGKEAYRLRTDKLLRILKKPVERRAPAGGNYSNRMGRNGLDSRVMDRHRRAGDPRRLAQKGAFARVRFDEFDPVHAHECQH